MDHTLHRLSEYAESHEVSRKLYGDAYKDAAAVFRRHHPEDTYGLLRLSQLERGTDRAKPQDGSTANADKPHLPARTKSGVAQVLLKFDALDKNHDGLLDQSEVDEALKNSPGHPEEAQVLTVLKDNYDLLHNLNTCNPQDDPPEFDFGISRDNLRELGELENGTDSLHDAVVRADISKGEGIGTLAGTIIGGTLANVAFPQAGTAGRMGGSAVGALLGSGLGSLGGTTAAVFDFHGVKRSAMQKFLKDVPASRTPSDNNSLTKALRAFVCPPKQDREHQ